VCPRSEIESTTESCFAACNASDLFGSWETLLLSIFSAIDLVYTLNANKKVLGLPPQIIHCNFFGSFLYIGIVYLTSSLPVSAVMTVLGKVKQ